MVESPGIEVLGFCMRRDVVDSVPLVKPNKHFFNIVDANDKN